MKNIDVIRCLECAWFTRSKLKSDYADDVWTKADWCEPFRVRCTADDYCSWTVNNEWLREIK